MKETRRGAVGFQRGTVFLVVCQSDDSGNVDIVFVMEHWVGGGGGKKERATVALVLSEKKCFQHRQNVSVLFQLRTAVSSLRSRCSTQTEGRRHGGEYMQLIMDWCNFLTKPSEQNLQSMSACMGPFWTDLWALSKLHICEC